MASRTTAGATLRVSAAAPATYDVTGYAALTWTTVGEITNFGEFGRVYALVTHNPVATRGTVKKKGSYNEGQMNLEMALDNDDAGQVILKAAEADDDNYSIELEAQNGDKYYFPALVMSFVRRFGGVDDITTAMVLLELTNVAGAGIIEDLV